MKLLIITGLGRSEDTYDDGEEEDKISINK